MEFNNSVTILKKWLPLVALAVAVVVHVLYFDHWGDTLARIVGGIVPVLGTLGVYGLALMLGLSLYLLISKVPRRFYYLYVALLVAIQVWCLFNLAVVWDRLNRLAAADDVVAAVAVAVVVGGFAGLAYVVLENFMQSVYRPDGSNGQGALHIFSGFCAFVFFFFLPYLETKRLQFEDLCFACKIGTVLWWFAVLIVCLWHYWDCRKERRTVGGLKPQETGNRINSRLINGA